MRRRSFLAAAALGALFGGVSHAQERVIKVVARKFEFVPAEITLEKGAPVVLELTTDDVAMGFLAPDFNADVEIVPGKVARVRLQPDRAGTFEFTCDVFCGEGHEEMSGRIHVR